MIVTTSGKQNKSLEMVAIDIANELQARVINRKKQSISSLQQRFQDKMIVVGKERYEFYDYNSSEPIFFHPNSASFRIKRLARGEEDPFALATDLKNGMSFFDGTLGLATDAIVASYLVGQKGKVIGYEENHMMAFLVKKGLLTWQSNNQQLTEAMRNIEVYNKHHLEALKSIESNSIDVVYFDPMFEEEIENSNGIKGLKKLALYETISSETIKEAKRVAKHRVVLKDHFRSTRMEELGFTRMVRKTSRFHYGVITIQ